MITETYRGNQHNPRLISPLFFSPLPQMVFLVQHSTMETGKKTS
uniref:Uncharacterized protein n=1 Tax=Arundo donax TaxID=35708 RepID=A0A0A9FF33_ARUDO